MGNRIITCISCREKHMANYCPNCGQKAWVEKVSFPSIFRSAFASLTEMDRGFLFNLKMLTTAPRTLVRDYLAGKRKGILNPVSFLLICVTLYLLVESLLYTPEAAPQGPTTDTGSIFYQGGKFIRIYFKYFWICSVFLLAATTKVVFGKYNYAEHLVISSLIIGYTTLIAILSFAVFRSPALVLDPIVYSVIFLQVYRIFSSPSGTSRNLLQAAGSVLLFAISLILIIAITGWIRTG